MCLFRTVCNYYRSSLIWKQDDKFVAFHTSFVTDLNSTELVQFIDLFIKFFTMFYYCESHKHLELFPWYIDDSYIIHKYLMGYIYLQSVVCV